MRVRSAALAVLMIGLTWALASCATPRRTITGAQAIQRIDDYLAEAVHAAPSGVQLIRTTAEATYGGGCTKGLTDSGFTGQVEADVQYQADDVSPDSWASYVDLLQRLWTKRWATTREPDGVRSSVNGDQFRLYGLFDERNRRVTVGGTSSCIWVHGTPGPGDNP